MARWTSEAAHTHKWKQTYSYLSQRDAFATPLGQPVDQSGSLTLGQECELCGKTRSQITIYAKDGSVEKVGYNE